MPAILKGWADRVLAMGWPTGRQVVRPGRFRGKRAMCSVTTGSPPPTFLPDGLHGDIRQILFPIHHGIMCFTGFDVMEPFLVYGPVRIGQEERVAQLERYRQAVLDLAHRPLMSSPAWRTTMRVDVSVRRPRKQHRVRPDDGGHVVPFSQQAQPRLLVLPERLLGGGDEGIVRGSRVARVDLALQHHRAETARPRARLQIGADGGIAHGQEAQVEGVQQEGASPLQQAGDGSSPPGRAARRAPCP